MSGRLMEARYMSPSGKEAAFKYETAARETELKTGVFTFPGLDGAHVQHQGMGARTFPLACIFSGDTYLDDADAFEAMLIERGTGELQHPYGTLKVTPTGNIKREDDFVAGIGQSLVNVTFTENSIGQDEGLAAAAADDINDRFEAFSDAAARDFAEGLDTDDVGEQLQIISELETQTQTITGGVAPLAQTDKKTFANWLTSVKELKDTIKKLYTKGLNAAGSIEDVCVCNGIEHSASYVTRS